MVGDCVYNSIRCTNLAVQACCCRLCHPWLTGTVPPDSTSYFRSKDGDSFSRLTA